MPTNRVVERSDHRIFFIRKKILGSLLLDMYVTLAGRSKRFQIEFDFICFQG